MSVEAEDSDVAGALEGETIDGTVLPRSFLVEGSGPVTAVRDHGDVVERTDGEVSLSRRLKTLDGFATFWSVRDLRHWKRNAIREVLEDYEGDDVRYVISDEQLEEWDVQVDGRADAFVGVAETIVNSEVDDEFDAPNQHFSGYVANPSGRTVDEMTLDLAKDLKTSPLWGPGARLAEVVVRHAEREDLEGYVEGLLEEVSG
ncbi:hypothetical protein [Natronobacterium gregoryi]|uniref:Uncharacterized protein n=2 Tax=Natronobacterium gregoryi TaxID=44930 RepID=L0AMB9_NATGS|nr:hypothetical protein [Natronobacterium gregoryi]AFZ74589.1 hypothetical protein Natgr_3470 [Natronobacterium gregoryi SP2]ELY72587.1 hypothetical protein C490_03323 [Natronobacterium gregoryi SP2]PLK19779.1 hypothetical protein CYV19_12790 [Natronobacterium gregoryi SP2]SFJ30031.1 hypothetical protein SAMN05443661_1217 [Natronobacterium gregoryi]